MSRAPRESIPEPDWAMPNLRGPRYSQSCVPRTMKEVRCRTNRRSWCCMRDGGTGRLFVWWPSAAASQEEAVNRPVLLQLRVVVVSVGETACRECIRCGSRRRTRVNH
jgi:hypothetical protein